jgi:hypothetical protein
MLLWNRVAYRRADGLLIRVGTAAPADQEAAVRRLTDFIEAFHPEIMRSLPQ